MKIKQIKETCIYLRNLAEAKNFYQNKLGLELIGEAEGRHVFFRVGNAVLLFFNPDVTREEKNLPPHYAEGKQHLAFEVPEADYEKWKEKLNSEGIIITHEQTWKKGLKSFYFNDPAGNVLEIVPEGIWN